MIPKCDVCGRGTNAGPLYRTNGYGSTGVWAHSMCRGVPVDPIVRDICNIIDPPDKYLGEESETGFQR